MWDLDAISSRIVLMKTYWHSRNCKLRYPSQELMHVLNIISACKFESRLIEHVTIANYILYTASCL